MFAVGSKTTQEQSTQDKERDRMASTQPVNNNNNNNNNDDDAARKHGDAATTGLERLYYPLMDTSSSSSSNNGGDECQGSVILYGNPQSSQMCFFCGGFPDNHTVWQPLVQRLVDNDNQKDDSPFCGVTCLAGFRDDDNNNNNKPRAGFTLPQMTQAFMTGMQTFRDASQHTDAEFTVILHDWGVVIGLMAMNEMLETQGMALPTRIILFDVLPKSSPDATSWPSKPVWQSWFAYGQELFLKGLYRLGLTTTFALSSWWTTIPWLTKIYLQTTVAIGRTFHLLPFPPSDWHVLEQRHAHGIYGLVATPALWYKCYPYYHAVRATLGGHYHTVFRYAHLPLLLCRPVLYLYGADKSVQFHSPDTIAWLRAQPHCQVVQVANAGHWLFLQQPDVCYRHVKDFMEPKKHN